MCLCEAYAGMHGEFKAIYVSDVYTLVYNETGCLNEY